MNDRNGSHCRALQCDPIRTYVATLFVNQSSLPLQRATPVIATPPGAAGVGDGHDDAPMASGLPEALQQQGQLRRVVVAQGRVVGGACPDSHF
jgi:hypothetical protein